MRFSHLVVCIVGQCGSVCGNGGGSPTCLACIAAQCLPAYKDCFGRLVCGFEYGCRDGFDNDVDARDLDCTDF